MMQMTLAGNGFERYGKTTCRAVFLRERDRVVPRDSPVMRAFAGIDLGREPVPDETTILRFRHLVERHGLGQRLLRAVNAHLAGAGIEVSTGAIVDATIISAPCSTKIEKGRNRTRSSEKGPHRLKNPGHNCAPPCFPATRASAGRRLPGMGLVQRLPDCGDTEASKLAALSRHEAAA